MSASTSRVRKRIDVDRNTHCAKPKPRRRRYIPSSLPDTSRRDVPVDPDHAALLHEDLERIWSSEPAAELDELTIRPRSIVVNITAQPTMAMAGPDAGKVIWNSRVPASYLSLFKRSTVSGEFTFTQRYNHTHPVIAFERQVMLLALHNYTMRALPDQSKVLEIGSRWWRDTSGWTTNNPCACATDAMHERDYPDISVGCKCLWPDCPHSEAATTLVMVHSLYYITERDVTDYLAMHTKQDLFVVIHDFTAPIPGMSFVTGQEDIVECYVGGTTYSHNTCGWLTHPKDYHLGVQLVAKLPYTLMYRLMYNPYAQPTPALKACAEEQLRAYMANYWIAKPFTDESFRLGVAAARAFDRAQTLHVSSATLQTAVSDTYHCPSRLQPYKAMRPRLRETLGVWWSHVTWWCFYRRILPALIRCFKMLIYLSIILLVCSALSHSVSAIHNPVKFLSTLVPRLPMAEAYGDFGLYDSVNTPPTYGLGWGRVPSVVLEWTQFHALHPSYHSIEFDFKPYLQHAGLYLPVKNQYQYLYGVGVVERPFSISQTSAGEIITYHERVLYPSVLSRLTSHMNPPSIVEVLRETVTSHDFEELSLDEWLNRFPLVKRRRILKALGHHTPTNWIKSMFTKRELISKDLIKAPRAIMMSSDTCNAQLGPFIVGVGNWLKEQWNIYSQITYASGMTAADAGAWLEVCIDQGYDYFYEDDFWNYDGTITTEWLLREQEVYSLFPHDDVVDTALAHQLSGVAYTKSGYRFRWEGGRKSGDPNTSLGNTLINAAVHYRAVPGDKRMLVMGDDIVIATRKPLSTGEVAAANAYMADCGLVSQLFSSDLYRLSFCSRWFWTTGQKWYLGPKLGRFLSRCGWTIKYQYQPDHWFGNNLHGFYGVLDLPILRQYRDWFAQSATDNSNEDDYYRFKDETVHAWNQCTADQFQHIYAVDPNAYFLSQKPALGATVALSVRALLDSE